MYTNLLSAATVQPDSAQKKTDRKQPRAHQNQAIKAILAAMLGNDRVTAVMPCGSGKTLVQLWVAESLNPKTVLVLVPSLALISQSLREWRRETSWESVAYLAVCHDRTVDQSEDDITVDIVDMGVEVTTQPLVIRKFLTSKATAAVKVIFCTYHSVRAFSAGLPSDMWIDLAVFDEAHRTAGKAGKAFAVALRDDAVRVRKRLFMTATPRHYGVRVQGGGAEAEPVYSMDDKTLYGPVAYCLTYQEAVQRKVILPYKVIIPVITRDTLSHEMLHRGGITIGDTKIKAHTVGCQIAIRNAMEKYDIRKAITFHESVADASRFTGDGEASIARHLPWVSCLHVNGSMPAGERAHIIEALCQISHAVISNQRCLTEGVDVPSVDMVAFLSPKRSVVDISQAIGRAMRVAPGKTCGYVLIPLLIEQASDKTLEKALRHSNFGEIWNVLQTMLEGDASIAETFYAQKTCRNVEQDRETASVRLFQDQVEIISEELTLEQLQESIVPHVLGRLCMSWETYYELLSQWHAKHGHCTVNRDTPEGERLAIWVSRQRQRCKQGRLNSEKIRKLDALGFVWDRDAAIWENKIKQVIDYKNANGHCSPNVNDKRKGSVPRLVQSLRSARKANRLPHWVIQKLDEIGFIWSVPDAEWEKNFERLVCFVETHGHCLPVNGNVQHGNLGAWCVNQRKLRKQGKLSKDRIDRLNARGFVWGPADVIWEKMFQKLMAVYNSGRLGEMNRRWPEDPKLGIWTSAQRQRRKIGKLGADRIKRLDAIGFSWGLRAASWEQWYKELIKFKSLNGHFQIPTRYAGYDQLYTWALAQRRNYRAGKMSHDRVCRLNAIGFDWETSNH